MGIIISSSIFWKCLVGLVSENIWGWNFHCENSFNCKVNSFNTYRAISWVICVFQGYIHFIISNRSKDSFIILLYCSESVIISPFILYFGNWCIFHFFAWLVWLVILSLTRYHSAVLNFVLLCFCFVLFCLSNLALSAFWEHILYDFNSF